MNRSLHSRLIGLAALCLLLSSCGGGGGGGAPSGGTTGGTTGGSTGGGTTGGSGGGTTPPSSPFSYDVGVGGTGGVVGPVTRFGSIVINGLVLNTDDAEFYIEGESGGVQNDLREGQQVIIAGDIGSADAAEVFYRSNLKGPLTAAPVVTDPLLGKGELLVLGQTVRVSSETRYVDVSLETLSEGDLVEVSGAIDPDGVVFATFIGGETTLDEYKAVGTVSALTAFGSFDLAGLDVDSSAASLESFPDDMLADGQFVEVRMPPDGFSNPPAVAVASEIELLPIPEISEGAELEIEGLIDRFESPTDFSVNGIPVTTDAGTQYEDGSSSLLQLGVAVEVEGVANAEGVVVADEVEFEFNATVRYEGPVVAVDIAAETLTTELGLIFEVDNFTEFEDETGMLGSLSLGDLAAGDYVEVRAFQDEGALIAVEVERESPDTRVKLRGRVSAFDESAGTALLLGVTVNETDSTTSYFDQNDEEINRTEFYQQIEVGAPLEVEWDDFVDAAQLADEMSLEEDES